jgi:hypothetical protein
MEGFKTRTGARFFVPLAFCAEAPKMVKMVTSTGAISAATAEALDWYIMSSLS